MALHSNSYAVIRRYLSAVVGDLIYGTADSGSTSTLVDAMLNRPAWGDDYFNKHGYELYIYDGTNEGLRAWVSDYQSTGQTITFTPAFAVANDTSSLYELHLMFPEDELRKAINLAIEFIADRYLIPIIDTTTIRLTSTTDNDDNTNYTFDYTLPTTMLYITRIITETSINGKKLTGTPSGTFTVDETVTGGTSGATGIFRYQSSTYILVREVDGTFETSETVTGGSSGQTIAPTAIADETVGYNKWEIDNEIDPRDWDIIRQGSATPQLRLNGSYYSVVEDLYLRIEGQGAQATVSDDDDVIYIPPDWLVAKAITFLPIWKLESSKLNAIYAWAQRESEKIPRSYPFPQSRKVIE